MRDRPGSVSCCVSYSTSGCSGPNATQTSCKASAGARAGTGLQRESTPGEDPHPPAGAGDDRVAVVRTQGYRSTHSSERESGYLRLCASLSSFNHQAAPQAEEGRGQGAASPAPEEKKKAARAAERPQSVCRPVRCCNGPGKTCDSGNDYPYAFVAPAQTGRDGDEARPAVYNDAA